MVPIFVTSRASPYAARTCIGCSRVRKSVNKPRSLQRLIEAPESKTRLGCRSRKSGVDTWCVEAVSSITR
eukprot:9360144-Ditylum_brightwellii.AAC.1